MTSPRLSVEEFEDLELQLVTAESALTHYRQAYELELSVGGPEPPSRPSGAKNGGGADGPKNSKPVKDKDGLRGRKRARPVHPASRISRMQQAKLRSGCRQAGPLS